MQSLPRLGQGTWHMGESPSHRAEEIASLRAGIEAGVTLIDTAEMYGNGGAESLVGEAIRGVSRESLFLVSKVYPHNAGGKRLVKSCEDTLSRLKTDVLDLYLLHWRGGIPLAETVAGMESLVCAGKIRRWGVSNFDTADMEELFQAPGGDRCAANQVLYHLGSRGVEYDLLPWLFAHGVAMMAYCPLAQAGRLRQGLVGHEAVQAVATQNGLTPFQVLLAFVLSKKGVTAIPKAASPAHARENAHMAGVFLAPDDLSLLSAAFPAPGRKVPLDIE